MQDAGEESVGVLVDADDQVSAFLKETSPFLSLPDGAPDWRLMGLIAPGLRHTVAKLLVSARRTGRSQQALARLTIGSDVKPILVAATPSDRSGIGMVEISFRWDDNAYAAAEQADAGPQALGLAPEDPVAGGGAGLADPRASQGLQHVPSAGTPASCGSSASNENELSGELQAANEELRSLNEELRLQVEEDGRQKVLIGELRHRIKNLLNTVQAIAMQTIRRSDSLEDFRTAFLQRIQALAACQDLLVRSGWHAVAMEDVIEASLMPHFRAGRDRLDNDMAGVRLPPSVAQAVALMLHELATNAAKYGALSTASGSLSVRCGPGDDGGSIVLRWAERGGPPAKPPAKRGFGLTMIEGTVRHELAGEISTSFAEEGLTVEARFPIPRD